MTSAPSFTEFPRRGGRALFGWQLRKNLGVSAILCAPGVLAQPVMMFIYYMSARRAAGTPLEGMFSGDVTALYQFTQFFVTFLSLAAAVIFASAVFEYLHVKNAVDVFHGLPLTRTELFLGNYFAGVILCLLPLCVNLPLNLAVTQWGGLWIIGDNDRKIQGVALAITLLGDFGRLVLMTAVCYTFTCFAFVNTGSKLDCFVTLFAVQATYPILVACLGSFFGNRIYGFVMPSDPDWYMLLSPFAKLFACVMLPFGVADGIYWAVFGVGIFFWSMRMMRVRKSELTGSGFAFLALKRTLKVAVPAAGGFATAFSFTSAMESEILFVAGFLAGTAVTYILTELIISRGFSDLMKDRVSPVCCGLILAGAYAFALTGGFGAETRTVDAADVRSVLLKTFDSDEISIWMDEVELTDEKSIRTFCDIQNRLTKEIKALRARQRFGTIVPLGFRNDSVRRVERFMGTDLHVVFRTAGGRTLERAYTIDSGLRAELLNSAARLPELRLKTNDLFRYDRLAWNKVEFIPLISFGKDIPPGEPSREQLNELKSAYAADIAADTAEKRGVPLGYLMFGETEAGRYTARMPVYESYTRTLLLLEKFGWRDRLNSDSLDGVHAYVVRNSPKLRDEYGSSLLDRGPGILTDPNRGPLPAAETSDPALTERLMAAAEAVGAAPEEDGICFILWKRNEEGEKEFTDWFFIGEERVPDEVRALKFRILRDEDL